MCNWLTTRRLPVTGKLIPRVLDSQSPNGSSAQFLVRVKYGTNVCAKFLCTNVHKSSMIEDVLSTDM